MKRSKNIFSQKNAQIAVLSAGLFLGGCGGGGGSSGGEKSSSTGGNTSSSSSSLLNISSTSHSSSSKGISIFSGTIMHTTPLKNAPVRLSVNDVVIYDTTTDANGMYSISQSEFQKILTQKGIGENDFIEVSSGTQLNYLTSKELDGSESNFVQDAVFKTLFGVNREKISEFQETGKLSKTLVETSVNTLLSKIKFPDTNTDGSVTLADLKNYNIAEYESFYEVVLKQKGYVEAVVLGDVQKQEYILQDVLQEDFESLQEESVVETIEEETNYTAVFPDPQEYENEKKTLSTQMTTLQKEIENLKKLSADSQTQKTQALKDLESQVQVLEQKYNSLDTVGQQLVSAEVSRTNKLILLDQHFSLQSSQTSQKIQHQKTSLLQKTSSLPELNPKEGNEVIGQKIQALQNEIAIIKRHLDIKEENYLKKYETYLLEKEKFEEDRRLYNEAKARYDEYTGYLGTMMQQMESYGTVEALGGLNVAGIVKLQGSVKALSTLKQKQSELIPPHPNNFSLDTTSANRKYNQVYNIKTFEYFGASFRIRTQFGATGNNKDYPAQVWLENLQDGATSSKVDIKEGAHLAAWRDYFQSTIAWSLFIAWVDAYGQTEKIRDQAAQDTHTYGNIALASKDIYQQEYDEYLTAKNSYDAKKTLYDQKNVQLIELKNRIISVEQDWENKNTLELRAVEMDMQFQSAVVKEGQVQQEVDVLAGKVREVDAKYEYNQNAGYILAFAQYVPSRFFMLDTISQTKSQNQITQIIDTKNKMTTFVQYNRKGTGKDYPAMVWVVYEDAQKKGNYYTEKIEVKDADQKEEVKKYLQQRVIESQSILKNGIHTEDGAEAVCEDASLGKPESNNFLVQYLRKSSYELGGYLQGKAIFKVGEITGESDYVVSSAIGYLESPQVIKELVIGTCKSYLSGLDSTVRLTTYGIAKVNDKIYHDAISRDILRRIENDIEIKGKKTLEDIDAFVGEMKSLIETIEYISQNLDSIENKEYWEGYIQGFLGAMVAEGVLLTSATKKAKTSFDKIKSGASFVRFEKMLEQLKGAIELRKITGISVNFEQYKRIVSRLDGVCSVGSQKIQKTTSCSPSGKFNGAIQVAKNLGFSQAKLKRYQDRMDLMDVAMTKEYVNKPELYAKNFEVDGKYNVVLFTSLKNIEKYIITLEKKGDLIYDTNYLGYGLFPADGKYLYVLQKGELKLVHSESELHDIKHSDIAGNKNIDYAGIITFSKGEVRKINNETGHYKVLIEDKKILFTHIKEKLGISQSQFESLFVPYY